MDMKASTASIEHMLPADVMLNAFPAGVIVCNGEGIIVQCNGELSRQFGYPMEHLIGLPVDKLLAEQYREQHYSLMQQYMRNPQKRIMGSGKALFGQRQDGSVFPVEIGLTPVETTDGLFVIASVADVTLRYQLEENFKRIVDAAPIGMLIVDETGRIQHANEQLARIFGYTEVELVGETLETLLPDRHRTLHRLHTRRYMNEPTKRAMGLERDLTGLHRNGTEIPVEIGLNPINTNHGKLIVATVIDITERKRAELKLKQANADLDEFTYVASHDLKSPIRGISSLLEWIEEDLGDNNTDAIKTNMERINLRIHRMEKLVDDLLAYARSGRQRGETTLIKLEEVINDVLQLISPPESFHIKLFIQPETINAALTPLQTVLRNMISNAINHHDRDDGNILIEVVADGAYVIFNIQDDGPGIPPSAHARVFKLFQSLSSEDGTRSGVGLAVCKRLIEAHGGRIELHSDGRGTLFRFWWPRIARRELYE